MGSVLQMSIELDEMTAALVRDQATRAGLSVDAYLTRHFRQLALRESVEAHAHWHAEHPGAVELELAEAQAARSEAA